MFEQTHLLLHYREAEKVAKGPKGLPTRRVGFNPLQSLFGLRKEKGSSESSMARQSSYVSAAPVSTAYQSPLFERETSSTMDDGRSEGGDSTPSSVRQITFRLDRLDSASLQAL